MRERGRWGRERERWMEMERAKGELYPWKHEERVMEERMRGERVM